MPRRERAKGLRGEREVAALYQGAGFEVRGLESGGDHLLVHADGLTLHGETKRQEVLRLPLWLRQAAAEAPPGAVPVVHFRQSHGRWYAALELTDLLALLTRPAGDDDYDDAAGRV